MSLFNFKSLIKKYSQGTVKALVTTEGYYDVDNGGVWVEGEVQEVLIKPGALVPLSNDDLKFDDAGTYTSDDRKLYCYKRIKKGTKIVYTNNSDVTSIYTIMAAKDYSDYDTGLMIYTLKRDDRHDADNI